MSTIRPATVEDGAALLWIEVEAGRRFAEIPGLEWVAGDDAGTVEELAAYALDGRSFVAVDETDAPVGYVIVDVIDDCAHVEQISVLPSHQGLGVGRALLERVDAWAVAHGCPAVTLTTFRDVPWNGPLYAHLGFVELGEGELGPELAALRIEEAGHGLRLEDRSCMRRLLSLDGRAARFGPASPSPRKPRLGTDADGRSAAMPVSGRAGGGS